MAGVAAVAASAAPITGLRAIYFGISGGPVHLPALDAALEAFAARNALQCGFCTPGMLASALACVAAGGPADRTAVRNDISGNCCRRTSYRSVVDAICDAIAAEKSAA